jgi:hypothetical protein
MNPIGVGYAPCAIILSKTNLSISSSVNGSFFYPFYNIKFFVYSRALLATFAATRSSVLVIYNFILLEGYVGLPWHHIPRIWD